MIRLYDTASIERCLRRDEALHVYELGDLDDAYRPYTAWYGIGHEGRLTHVALLYSASVLPVLLAFTRLPLDGMAALLDSLRGLLPCRWYAHLTPGLERMLSRDYSLASRGRFLKMALSDAAALDAIDTSGACTLGIDDRAELLAFYRASYPGNWLDPRMRGTGRYVGYRVCGALVAVAGVHVYSPLFRVAALGNIATHPDHRGKGLATMVTARLCRQLRDEVTTIGLNVSRENELAIRCYRRLGFVEVAPYGEFMATRRHLR